MDNSFVAAKNVGALVVRPMDCEKFRLMFQTICHVERPPSAFTSSSSSSMFRSTRAPHTRSYFPVSRQHINSRPRKLMVDLNPRYVSKLSHNANGKPTGTNPSSSVGPASQRHHPYHVPSARSRTKSETASDCRQAARATTTPQATHPSATSATSLLNNAANNGPLLPTGMWPTGSHSALLPSASNLPPLPTTATTNSLLLGGVKSRSMEDVSRMADDDMPEHHVSGGGDGGASMSTHEMEYMSSRIQQLRVDN